MIKALGYYFRVAAVMALVHLINPAILNFPQNYFKKQLFNITDFFKFAEALCISSLEFILFLFLPQ